VALVKDGGRGTARIGLARLGGRGMV